MKLFAPIRFLVVSSLALIASSAHAWTYDDSYNDTNNFRIFFNIYGSGATASYHTMTEAGNRYLRSTLGPSDFGPGTARFMAGIFRELTFNDIYPIYNPAIEGPFANIQLDVDTRFVSSVGPTFATLGLLFLQGGDECFADTGIKITNSSWQRISTGPISLGSIFNPARNSFLDLSPGAAQIYVGVGLHITSVDSTAPTTVTIDIDHPTIRTNVVPEPGSLAVFGVAGFAFLIRKRKKV